MKNIRYWVGFNHVGGIGPVRLKLLLDHFGNIEAAWKASAIITAGEERRMRMKSFHL